jgi:cellulose synthase (UDP-forming)
VVGPLRVGSDLLGNDPTAFYELVQRRRNWANASFCCGAGSVHRREAVMTAALAALGREVEGEVAPFRRDIEDLELCQQMEGMVASEAARGIEVKPYEFHVSEDIFTSLLLHASKEPKFRSVFHPNALCKMLSPQDLKSWSIQRFKYAGGTLDIFFRHARKRLRGLGPWQALMYGATVAGYLTPLWLLPLFASSLAFLYFGVSTVRDDGGGLLRYLLPFLILDRTARMVRSWGVDTARDEAYAVASFWLHLQALVHVFRGRPIKFHVTPKMRQHGSVLPFVWPHCVLMLLFAAGGVALLLRAEREHVPAPGLVLHCGFALSVLRALSLPVRAALSHSSVEAS